MFAWIPGLVNCCRGRHERSERHVVKVGDGYVSQCRFCRTKLRRVAKRRWAVLD